MQPIIIRVLFIALIVSIMASRSPAYAELLGRLPATPGGSDYQAYYDTELDITWLADASLAQSNTFGVSPINDNNTLNPGAMWISTAASYVAAANAAEYLGFSTWRLPKIEPIDGVSFDYIPQTDGSSDRGYNLGAPGTEFEGSTASELAHLYYTTLGNLGYYDVNGGLNSCSPVYPGCLAETGPFTNLLGYSYWIGTPYDPNPNGVWGFSFNLGEQEAYDFSFRSQVWLVLDGDVGAPDVCGDANSDGAVSAPDALAALLAAVGLQSCELCHCDSDGSGAVAASDALVILQSAVHLPVTLSCPAC